MINKKEIELLESAVEGLRTCGEPDKRLIWTERLVRVIPKYINLIAKVERMDKEIEKLQHVCDYTEEVLDLVSQNPYCKEIFPEPTKEQYALFHSILQKHGLTLDRFSASVSRKAWDGFKALVENKLRAAIKEVKK